MKRFFKINRAVHSAHGNAPTDDKTIHVSRKPYKTRDTTQLTQEDHDVICNTYRLFIEHNMNAPRNEKMSTITLAARINTHLGTDKSVSALGRVWQGDIRKEHLPTRAEVENANL